MHTRLKTIMAACAWTALACAAPSLAQVKPKTPPKPAAAPPQPITAPAAQAAPAAAPAAADATQTPPPPEWVSRCASDARQGALECAVEQTAFLSKTGQLVAAVTIRVPPDTRQPTMAIQVPVGLFLPGGVSLQIDDGKPLTLALQTCDLKGCYAGMMVTPEMLAALRAGKKLAITFQSLSKENITIPMQLTNFAQAYQKIQ
ncbi:MAG: invasion associated locus B family protein [Hyphomicrobiales bacterium]